MEKVNLNHQSFQEQGSSTKPRFKSSALVVSIDIGTTKICATAGRLNEFGKVEVLAVGKVESRGVSAGEVVDVIATGSDIKEAYNRMCLALAGREEPIIQVPKKVIVGIAGSNIKSRRHQVERMRPNHDESITAEELAELESLARKVSLDADQRILHLLVQGYQIDHYSRVPNPIGRIGSNIKATYHMVLTSKTPAIHIQKSLEIAGLEIDELYLEPLASAQAVLEPNALFDGCAVVDIGGGTTDVAIYKDNTVQHTAVIPLGGHVITSDISHCFKLNLRSSEALKIQRGSCIPNQVNKDEVIGIPLPAGRGHLEVSTYVLAQVINARVLELLELVNNAIVHSGVKDALHDGLIITGGGSLLNHLCQYAEFITGMNTRIGTPNQFLAKGNDDIKSPVFATSIGLMMQGLRKVVQAEIDHAADAIQMEKTTLNASEVEVEIEDPSKTEQYKSFANKSWLSSFQEKISDFFLKGIEKDDFK